MTFRYGFRMTLAALLALSLASPSAFADEEKRGFSGKAGFGYLASSGNSDASAVNGTLELFYDLERWHHSLALLGSGTTTEGVTSGERYKADLKSDFDWTEKDYFYGLISYEKDNDSGVREKLSETVGYGRHVLNNETHVLDVEAGVGFQQLDFADGTDDSSAVVRVGGDYTFQFSDSAQFNSNLSVEIGSDNTYTQWVNGVTAKLAETLSLVVSYTVKNNSEVPPGLDDTDTYTAINIEYGF